MQKMTFSKNWSVKISMTCVHIKPEVKKMIQLQMGDYIKIAIWWVKNGILIVESINLLRGFWLEKWVNFWQLGGILLHP